LNLRVFNLCLLVGWLMVLAGGVVINIGWGIAVAGGLLLVLVLIGAYLGGLYDPKKADKSAGEGG
jgi:hypothetical protein